MTSPTPHRVYTENQRAGTAVSFQQWPTAHLPPLVHQESAGVHTLWEVILGTPSKLLPPYPCIGHYSLLSPSAASFKRAPSPDPASKSPPWPSKHPSADDCGSALRRASNKSTSQSLEWTSPKSSKLAEAVRLKFHSSKQKEKT